MAIVISHLEPALSNVRFQNMRDGQRVYPPQPKWPCVFDF
jgi:hypothetical protein